MEMLGYRFTQVLGHLPVLLTLLAVLVLAATAHRRLPGRTRSLLVAGAAVLLLLELISTAWVVTLPDLVRSGGIRQYQLWNLMVSVVGWIGYPVGLGLLVAAVFAGRAAPPAPGNPWGGWTPPANGPGTGFPAEGFPNTGPTAPATGFPAGGFPGTGPAAPVQATGPWGGGNRPPTTPQQVDRTD
ncbi:hypothetical protein ACIG87_12740 [Micromonospora sp. NPDC051925]|uniref:hypothetical protein n=1 Tax=Micromonospora sp. NPDC051925 TaxID=3364288 RepID=UPI0037CBAB99